MTHLKKPVLCLESWYLANQRTNKNTSACLGHTMQFANYTCGKSSSGHQTTDPKRLQYHVDGKESEPS